MIKYCIDSNIVIYMLDGLNQAEEFMKEAEIHEIVYPVIVEAELFSSAKLTEEDMQDIRDVLDIGEIIEVNSAIALKAGELRRTSKFLYDRKLRLPDALVAATAIIHSAILVTRNYEDFIHLLKHGLELYNPFT